VIQHVAQIGMSFVFAVNRLNRIKRLPVLNHIIWQAIPPADRIIYRIAATL